APGAFAVVALPARPYGGQLLRPVVPVGRPRVAPTHSGRLAASATAACAAVARSGPIPTLPRRRFGVRSGCPAMPSAAAWPPPTLPGRQPHAANPAYVLSS